MEKQMDDSVHWSNLLYEFVFSDRSGTLRDNMFANIIKDIDNYTNCQKVAYMMTLLIKPMTRFYK